MLPLASRGAVGEVGRCGIEHPRVVRERRRGQLRDLVGHLGIDDDPIHPRYPRPVPGRPASASRASIRARIPAPDALPASARPVRCTSAAVASTRK